jgi:hypothetical protein
MQWVKNWLKSSKKNDINLFFSMLKIVNTAKDSKLREKKALVNDYLCLLEPPISGSIPHDGRCERNIVRFAAI